jgi:hypothetical protein
MTTTTPTDWPRRPVDHARAAAEAIRALNHVTLFLDGADGYQWPADVDAVIVELAAAAGRLPQALDQAARWISQTHDRGQVGHDQGHDVRAAVACTLIGLDAAAMAAARLHSALARVQTRTSHLTCTHNPGTPGGPR